MIDNLALGAKALNSGVTISSANTNNPNISKFTAASLANNTANFTDANVANCQTPYINTGSATLSSSTYGTSAGWKYGVYYNYCAASAGTICMDISFATTDAPGDICPAGWQMPSGGFGGDYETLYNNYGNYTSFVAALHTPLAGFFFGGQPNEQGDRGFFWSRTRSAAGGSANMHRLIVNGSSGINPVNYDSRYLGISVRCVLK